MNHPFNSFEIFGQAARFAPSISFTSFLRLRPFYIFAPSKKLQSAVVPFQSKNQIKENREKNL
jgi:hypothetical protein